MNSAVPVAKRGFPSTEKSGAIDPAKRKRRASSLTTETLESLAEATKVICEEELDWRRRKRWFNNQIRKDKKTFYYMDLMYLPDELDLQDNDKEDKARVRKQEGDKFGIVNETDDEESGEEKSNAESGAETASDSSDEGNNNA